MTRILRRKRTCVLHSAPRATRETKNRVTGDRHRHHGCRRGRPAVATPARLRGRRAPRRRRGSLCRVRLRVAQCHTGLGLPRRTLPRRTRVQVLRGSVHAATPDSDSRKSRMPAAACQPGRVACPWKCSVPPDFVASVAVRRRVGDSESCRRNAADLRHGWCGHCGVMKTVGAVVASWWSPTESRPRVVAAAASLPVRRRQASRTRATRMPSKYCRPGRGPQARPPWEVRVEARGMS